MHRDGHRHADVGEAPDPETEKRFSTFMKIVILGSGNIAMLAGETFKRNGEKIVCVWSRSAQGKKLAKKLRAVYTEKISRVPDDADLYVIAVKDDAILAVAKKLRIRHGILIHTSGFQPLSI